jgi:hypothetical protein
MAIDRDLTDALSAPLGELIASIGRGVADAQRALDAQALTALREIYESDEEFFRELQAIGYRPTWYHIPEAQGQIQVALSLSGTQDQGPQSPAGGVQPAARIRLYAAPLDAGYTSRYNFSLTASSSLTFRIVPVPPSPAVEAIRIMPSVVDLSLSEAMDRLARLGIEASAPDVPGTTVVTTQSPAPGTVLEPDIDVTVGTA